MTKMPWVNHGWHVTTFGLSNSPVIDADHYFQIDFDFVEHRLFICTSDGEQRSFELKPMAMADFYTQVTRALAESGARGACNIESVAQ